MAIDQAREELQRAAMTLGRLAAEAANAGLFDETITIARWAASVAELVEPPTALTPGQAESPHYSSAPLGVRTTQSKQDQRRSGRATRRGTANTPYPRFERRAADLIKFGWSKREKSEYEQKAPKDVIDRVTRELARRATEGAPISSEQLLPLIRPEDGREIPSYQVYVVLAWLRARGFIEAVGRQGYRVLAKDLSREMDRAWSAL